MIDFKEIDSEGEKWELFARDYLEEAGFFIEMPPDRGADGGKDMLVTEEIKGKLHRDKFRWLVSCKHFAHSNKSVNENDHEKNILERLRGFRADGFIGFYSTLASAGLNNRLAQLKSEKHVRDYRIFDHKLIENHLLAKGYSNIILRYFPESYKKIRPIHNIIDEYIALNCDHCGKDLLEALYYDGRKALVAQVSTIDNDGIWHISETYFACKGECDKVLSKIAWNKYQTSTSWKDLYDLAMPNQYLRWILSTINQLASGRYIYSDESLNKEKLLIIALSQKIFREASEKEKEHLRELLSYGL